MNRAPPSGPTEFSWSEFDRRQMARAISLGRRGQGCVEPNPMVGCVVVRNGRVIGEGFHRRFGGPHAEVNALASCHQNPRGATVYVSLEPCCHFGKTSPCTDAMIRAGVRRVIAATRDPNPMVAGKGLRALRDAGVVVESGLLGEQARELIAPFRRYQLSQRPYIIAKWAQSLDGKLATAKGESMWISGEESRRFVHRLRARVDAVLVGSGTVLSDDPMLTARGVPLRRVAARVVLDGRMRTPDGCRLVATAKRVPTLLFTGPSQARSPKARRLRAKNVEVIACPAVRGRLSLRRCLAELRTRGMTNVLVEGGAGVLSSFFDTGSVDEAFVFVAPFLIGGAGPGPLESCRTRRLGDVRKSVTCRVRRSGADMCYGLRFAF